MPNRIAVVDGANIAYSERSQKGDPKVSNIVSVRAALQKKGYEPLIIVDASLVYEIDDRPQLEALINDQIVRPAPASTDAYYFVISCADENTALINSNDQFARHPTDHPWIETRRVPVMLINGEAELYEPKLEENREQH